MALLAASSSLSCLSLRSAQASASAPSGSHSSRATAASPLHSPSLSSPSSSLSISPLNVEFGGSALAGALFAAIATSDSAAAAQEVINLAASADDNRGLGLLLTLVPAIGWVLFNILQPALSQIDRMKSAKGLAVGLGLGAATSLLLTLRADAAVQEIADVAADNDSRGLLLLFVLVPAIGWVLFNILKPALSQLDKMKSVKGIAGVVGLAGAMLVAVSGADAAVQEITAIGEGTSSDARGLLLLGVLIPAVGWVLFNILQPALNQLDKMKTSKGIAAAIGLGGAAAASAMFPLRSDALQDLATVADNDSRGTLLLGVLIPAIGWVLFNILQPALSQVEKMRAQK